MANPIVSSLPAYVDEQRLPLIAKSVLGAKTAGLLTLQTGVKGKTALNLLNTDITFQDAKTCGFNATGSVTLSQRYIEPAYLKVNMEFCDKNVIGTYAQHEVKIAAGLKTLPFEKEYTDSIVEKVDEAVETMIWQGQKSDGAEFDGILTILNGVSLTASRASGTSTPVWDSIKAAYAKLPENAIAEDTVIFVGAGDFRAFIQELIGANLYHYNANDNSGEYTLPGTNVKVISVNGLNNTGKIVAGRTSNIFIGVDMAGDEEKFEMWYSQDDRTFKLVIEFMMGVQVAFPDEIVVCA